MNVYAITYQGELYVDGGYTNNLPLDVMLQRHNPKTVFAVDVEDKDMSTYRNIYAFGDHLSGWWLMWRIILAKLRIMDPVHIPTQHDVTLLLSYISHAIMLNRMLSTLDLESNVIYLRPRVWHYKLLDYNKMATISDIGYHEAANRIKTWKSKHEKRQVFESTDESALHIHKSPSFSKMLRSRSMLSLSVSGVHNIPLRAPNFLSTSSDSHRESVLMRSRPASDADTFPLAETKAASHTFNVVDSIPKNPPIVEQKPKIQHRRGSLPI